MAFSCCGSPKEGIGPTLKTDGVPCLQVNGDFALHSLQRARQVRNTVGGLGKTLEEGPEAYNLVRLPRHVPSAVLSFQQVQSMLTTPANNGLRRRAVKTCQRSEI